MAKRAACCWLSIFIFSCCLAGAYGAERATILRVRQGRQEAAPNREAAPVELRLEKFLIVAPAPVPGETFRVEWQPVGRALEAGVVLRFEYRQERVRKMQQLTIRYPFAIGQRRTATFEIAPAAAQSGGAVTAWRVRVERDGRVLAEQRSPTWSATTP